MEEVSQVIAQLSTFEKLRIITQNVNSGTIKCLEWEDFNTEEKAQLNSVIEMIKSK
jgi:hypothetical protein